MNFFMGARYSLVKSLDGFENGCISMHCGAQVVTSRSDVLVYSVIGLLFVCQSVCERDSS